MTLRHTLIALLTVLTATFTAAADRLDTACARAAAIPGLTATFSVDGQGGTLTMAADKFVVTLPGMAVYFDGTTQWAVAEADSEVTIVTPTADEIAGINPLAFVGGMKRLFKARALADGSVQLTPAQSGTALPEETLVRFGPKGTWPVQIRVTSGGHTSLIDQISVREHSAPLPASTFTPVIPRHYTVTDLR